VNSKSPKSAKSSLSRLPHPFVKWAGGKRQLLPKLLEHVPPVCGRYIEPFVGGGALFWALSNLWSQGEVDCEKGVILSDANAELMKTYEVIQNARLLPKLIQHLESRLHSEGHYLVTRDLNWKSFMNPVDVASRFIYLNKTCFNGLYRVNRKGFFNVPMGKWKKMPTICDEENLRACHQALQGVRLYTQDFLSTTSNAEKGDFVYFDPPYIPVSATSNFTSFTESDFTMKDQEALAEEAKRLKDLGVTVLLSNSGSPKTTALYEKNGFRVTPVRARRSINSASEFRDAVIEFVIH
jgi:DNA adenine methylase